MREGNFNRVEKGLGVRSQELESGEVIAHAKSAKFAKSDVESQKSGTDFFNAEKQSSREAEVERGNVLTQRHKGTEGLGVSSQELGLAATTFAKATVVKKNTKSAKGWPMVRLGDVCEVKAGATHHGIESANGKYPVYGSGGYICHATEYRCPAGTVTVGRKGTLDNPLLINEPFWNIDTCFGVIPKEKIDARYLWRFCQNFDFYNLVPSLGRPSTNSDAIRNIQIPLPPSEVQKEIVERLEKELGAADKVAAEFKRMVELADKEFKAELDETFGELREKGSGVSSQELGLAAKNAKGAKDWPMVRLGEIAAINGGFAFKSANYTSNGVRVIRISDFNESGFVNNKIVRHPYDDGLKPYILELKDILLCMTGGTVGKCLFVTQMEEVMVVNQRVATIKVKNDMPKYVYWVLSSSITQRVVQYSKNSLNDNISLDTIKGFLIPLPPIEVQNEIVAKLDAAKDRCEKLKAEAERGLRAAENLRKAILSEAFE